MADPAELIVNAKELVALLRSHAGEPWMTIGGRPFALDAAYTIDALLAALSPAPTVPPGFKLVPVEPTLEMIEAGYSAGMWDNENLTSFAQSESACDVYAAMLAASPQPPVVEGWRDIASAPRNNTSRLVWCPLDRCIYCVAWVDNSEYPPAISGWQVFGGGEIIDGVTHWQPLPAPPAPEAGR